MRRTVPAWLLAFCLTFLPLCASVETDFVRDRVSESVAKSSSEQNGGRELPFTEEQAAGDGTAAGEATPAPDHLTVGNATALSGNFTTRAFGSNTSDLDVSALVNGYNLVAWDEAEGAFRMDESAVSGLNVSQDEAGDRVYQIALVPGNTWSDGTPITAADYAFSILFSASPAVAALGGDTANYLWIEGMEAYRAGETDTVTGLRVLSDDMLRVTVSAAWLPFFYELGYLSCFPLPIEAVAPGCEVQDVGQGAFIEGAMTPELLRETLLDEETGYLSHPSVVSGPYRLLSFDRESAVAEFEINDLYRGDRLGRKPSIRFLTLRPAGGTAAVDDLRAGNLDLINKAVNLEEIQQGIGLVTEGLAAMTTYARTGESFLSFNCEKPEVASVAVRQALSCCLDKAETVRRYTGGYGLRVDGYYGIGQWMVQILTGAAGAPVPEPADGSAAALRAYEEELAAWEELSLDAIPAWELDVPRAIALLEEDGWVLNSAGEPYDAARDAFRCKREGAELLSMNLTLALPEETGMGEILRETFLPYLREAGIRVTLSPLPWRTLLRQYYRQEPRQAQMMLLASNFETVFDPRLTVNPADAESGMANYTAVRDGELYRLAEDLSKTEPGDLLGYVRKWLAFQQRYQQVVPAIGLYSNAYFDFYTPRLQNYQVDANITWSEAILSAALE